MPEPLAEVAARPDAESLARPVEPHRALLAAILLAVAALVAVALRRNVNWDEFYFLSHVHAALEGRLDRPMQTVFVHAFGWLDRLPGEEIGEIVAARFVMLGFVVLTLASIYRLALQRTSQTAALIAVLGFLTSGYTLIHGGSFRADPMAAGLNLASIAILATTRLAALQILAAATLSALAALVTVKSALYAPAYVAVLLVRWDETAVPPRIAAAGVLAALVAVPLYLWHASGVVAAPGADTASNARGAIATVFLQGELFPRAGETLTWTLLSLGPLVLAGAGIGARQSGRQRLLLILFAAPLFSVVAYRNAFPYYFPFAAPLLMVAAAVGAERLRGTRILALCVAMMAVSGAGQAALALRDGMRAQRTTLAEVHRLFPEPVPYIGDSGMVASFPRLGFFMSSWGVQDYRAEGEPVFAELIERHRPPLLLANKPALARTMQSPGSGARPPLLLPQDHALLRASYVRYRGPIFLAGAAATLDGTPEPLTLPFPGTYRVETSSVLTIDGQLARDGDVIDITSATPTVSGTPGTDVRLVWATGEGPSADSAPIGPVYAPFRTLAP